MSIPKKNSNPKTQEQGALDIKKENLRDGPVLYISSPIALKDTSSFDYFVSIINFLSHYVSTLLDKELIVKVPISSDPSEQINLFDNALSSCSNSIEYSAIIIAPVSAKSFKEHLNNDPNLLKKIIHSIPIYTIDKKVPELSCELQIPYVTGNWFFGGTLAGQAAVEWINNLQNSSNRVLIVRGKEGSQSRISGFKKYLRMNSPHIDIQVTDQALDYSREDAFNYLNTNRTKYKLESFDVIYCCNDEMALGVRELILRADLGTNRIAIIGFDGTIEFEWLKRYEQNHLYKTVDVMIENQIRVLVSKISQFEYEKYIMSPRKFCYTQKVSI